MAVTLQIDIPLTTVRKNVLLDIAGGAIKLVCKLMLHFEAHLDYCCLKSVATYFIFHPLQCTYLNCNI